MPDDAKEKRQQIVDDLEDLISQLAQQSDSRATNLQVMIEEQGKQIEASAEKREKRRWAWFSSVILGLIIALTIAGVEAWERNYAKIAEIQADMARIEQRQKFIKEQTLQKYEFQSMLLELHRARDEARREILDQLEKDLRKEMKELHPRK